jgi:uncharacterized protein
MSVADLEDFGSVDLGKRLLQGGLPPFFLAERPSDGDYQEWVDSYWSKDVDRLFRVSRRASFERVFELLLAQSGGLFDASRFARDAGVSRPTLASYLSILQQTHVAQVVRPFSSRKATEIVATPKVYAFDTGFVAWARGWTELRPDDLGQLWEHYVLNELCSLGHGRAVRHWRDKRGHEVDFVLLARTRPIAAIECKWSMRAFDPTGLAAFRRAHPGVDAWLVAQDADGEHVRDVGGERVTVMSLRALRSRLSRHG